MKNSVSKYFHMIAFGRKVKFNAYAVNNCHEIMNTGFFSLAIERFYRIIISLLQFWSSCAKIKRGCQQVAASFS